MNPKQQQPTGQPPVMDVQRPRTNPAPSVVMPQAGQVVGQAPQPQQPTVQPQPVKIKKKRTGLIIAIVTILVILLIGGAVAGFIVYNNNSKPAPAVTETQSETQRVNVEEIDATTAEIDKTLNTMNDSTDVTPGETSDATLGL